MSTALKDLDPGWETIDGRVVGVLFQCPHCRGQHVLCYFANPPDGGPPIDPSVDPGIFRWRRTGTTFDDLTLSPSVDGSRNGHWHGWLENGLCTDDAGAPCVRAGTVRQ